MELGGTHPHEEAVVSNALIDDLADKLVTDLTDHTWSKTVTVTAHDDPELSIEALAAASGVVVYVVADSWDETSDRDRLGFGAEEYGLWLVVAQKLADDTVAGRAAVDDQVERRELRYLVEEMRVFLRKQNRITINANGDTALWQRAGNRKDEKLWPWMNKEAIRQRGLFLSGTYLVYAV